MRKNRERIFRFPFDIDTRVFLALTLIFFIFSIESVQQFLGGTNSISKVQTLIEKDIQQKLKDAKKTLNGKTVTSLSTLGFTSPDAAALLKKPYYIYIYQKGELIFWNQNRIQPKTENTKAVCALVSSDREFVQIKINETPSAVIDVYVLIPIKSNRNHSGVGYLDAFNSCNNYGYDVQTTHDQHALPIRVANETPYYLIRTNEPVDLYDPYGWKLFICALPFIFMGISIHTYFKVVLQFRNKLLVWCALILFAVVVRTLTLTTGFPNDFISFRPFNPAIFHHDYVNRSLGDTFINVCLLFWILLFYIMNIQGLPILEKLFSKGKILVFVKMTALIGLCLYQVQLISKMVVNSSLVFDTSLFTAIDHLTFIGILTFMVAMANVLLCTYIISNRFSILQSPKWPKYIFILSLYAVFIFIGKKYVDLSVIHFLFLLLIILLFLMDEKRMRIRFDFNSYELILWIICFSLFSTSFFIYNIERKEKNDRLAYAQHILKGTDMKQSAQNIFCIRKIILNELKANPYSESNFSSFQSALIQKYFYPLLENYKITLSRPGEGLPLKIERQLSAYNTMYDEQGTDSIMAQQNAQEMCFAFPLQLFNDSSKTCMVHISKVLLPLTNDERKMDFAAEDTPFNNYEYGIGLFSDSILTGNNGYHLLPSTIQPSTLFANRSHFLRDTLSKSELWYHDADGKTVVVAKTKNTFSRFLTLFAVLFFIYFTVISFYILGNIIARSNLGKKRFLNLLNLNLRLRIHGTILVTMLFAFIAVGYFTSYYLISQYNSSTSQKAMERIAGVKAALFPVYKNVQNKKQMTDTLYHECRRLSDEMGFPISLFDYDSGKLLYSTSDLLNNARFPVNHLAPEALWSLMRHGSSYYSISEKQAHQDNYNTFSVLQGPGKGSKFVLQMPFHQSGIYFRQETFSVIVTLINTFVVVFLISAFISLLLTNSVVEPFKFIMKRFTKINLAGTNEPLPWKYSDEMGVLVREYNRMLRTLENRTQLLARSEREMAWREMAKQVAHEIKNPLTPMKLSLQLLEKAIKEKKSNIPEMAERMTKTMIEQIETLSVIATNFSTFARMPENKNEVMLLNDVLTAVTGMYTNDQQIEYEFSIPQYPVYIFADKTQLIRVFTNIIQNAIQSLPETNKGMISMSVQKVKNNFIRVRISDNGIGISKEKGEKLFQPYFTTKSSGTGLGLAMCKDIIDQLNGSISFESVEEQGTTFFVDLPIYETEMPTT